jgi:HAE1 family hydrophobic/amphiphilic exporter-1
MRMGRGRVSTIYAANNEYRVILEALPEYQRDPTALSRDCMFEVVVGVLVPIDSLVEIDRGVGPLTVNHSGQLPSVTISFDIKPGSSLGDALAKAQAAAREVLPATMTTGFQGTAQEFQRSARGLALLLIAAVVVIYLVMGMLYESFIHPITILSGLPSAGVGAFLTLAVLWQRAESLFDGRFDYVGRHREEECDHDDRLCSRGGAQAWEDTEEAIYEASLVRFRPIMMTTMAAFLGALPIALGWGAGAESRQP